VSGAGGAARESAAASDESGAGAPTRALTQLRAASSQSWQQAAVLGGMWAERGAALVRALVRPRLMRQAVAAARRGNLDAAFALLREEVGERPGVPKSTLLFWGVALSCNRAAEAAAPMARLVRDEAAAGRAAAAADQWLALVAEVPGAVLDVATLARIVPVLRTRYSEARGEKAQKLAASACSTRCAAASTRRAACSRWPSRCGSSKRRAGSTSTSRAARPRRRSPRPACMRPSARG